LNSNGKVDRRGVASIVRIALESAVTGG